MAKVPKPIASNHTTQQQAAQLLPTLIGHTPRNLQEKISSRYKAWEFLYYLYSLGPGVSGVQSLLTLSPLEEQ